MCLEEMALLGAGESLLQTRRLPYPIRFDLPLLCLQWFPMRIFGIDVHAPSSLAGF